MAEMCLGKEETTMTKPAIHIIALILATAGVIHAQERPMGGGGFTTDPIRVVRSYEAVLADALKVAPVPQLPTVESEKKELTYTGINRMAPTAVELAPLTPLRALPEPPGESGSGHLRLGGGNYRTPLADLRLSSKRDPNFEYGLTAQHFSSAGNLRVDTLRLDHANLSDNHLGVYGKRYLNKLYLHSNFEYDRMARHFYGMHQAVEIPRDSIRQVFNRFRGTLGLKSHLVEADQVDYHVKFSFYSLADRYEQSENNLRLDGGLLVRLDENKVNFDFAVDYTNFNSTFDVSNGRNLIYFQPSYQIEKPTFILKAGFNLVTEASGGTSQFRIFPNIDFTYLVNDVYMLAYGGVTGNIERVAFDDIIRINPFVGTGLDIRNQQNRLHLYGGLKGSLDELTSYNVYVGYQRLAQTMFFLNDTTDFSRLLPVYDSSTNLLNLRFELNRKFGDRYTAHIKGDFRKYGLSNLEAPFMQPTAAIRLGGTYNLQSTLRLSAEAIVFNGVSYFDAQSPANLERLKGVFDLNAGIQYDYNKSFGFFLNVNNITSARYFRWFNYPTFGFNVLGGLNLKF
jgi:hypothetical protein